MVKKLFTNNFRFEFKKNLIISIVLIILCLSSKIIAETTAKSHAHKHKDKIDNVSASGQNKESKDSKEIKNPKKEENIKENSESVKKESIFANFLYLVNQYKWPIFASTILITLTTLLLKNRKVSIKKNSLIRVNSSCPTSANSVGSTNSAQPITSKLAAIFASNTASSSTSTTTVSTESSKPKSAFAETLMTSLPSSSSTITLSSSLSSSSPSSSSSALIELTNSAVGQNDGQPFEAGLKSWICISEDKTNVASSGVVAQDGGRTDSKKK